MTSCRTRIFTMSRRESERSHKEIQYEVHYEVHSEVRKRSLRASGRVMANLTTRFNTSTATKFRTSSRLPHAFSSPWSRVKKIVAFSLTSPKSRGGNLLWSNVLIFL